MINEHKTTLAALEPALISLGDDFRMAATGKLNALESRASENFNGVSSLAGLDKGYFKKANNSLRQRFETYLSLIRCNDEGFQLTLAILRQISKRHNLTPDTPAPLVPLEFIDAVHRRGEYQTEVYNYVGKAERAAMMMALRHLGSEKKLQPKIRDATRTAVYQNKDDLDETTAHDLRLISDDTLIGHYFDSARQHMAMAGIELGYLGAGKSVRIRFDDALCDIKTSAAQAHLQDAARALGVGAHRLKRLDDALKAQPRPN